MTRIHSRVEDGWLRVTYTGPELAQVALSVGTDAPGPWVAAFVNTLPSGERVVQVRPHNVGLQAVANPQVWMLVDGAAVLVGRLGAAVPDVATGRRRR